VAADRPPLVRGRIDSAPAGGLVDVVIPSFDGEQRFTGCPYTPHGTTDPAPGDDCLVGFDDLHTAWVVLWRPSS
jgi:hypothetical protein